MAGAACAVQSGLAGSLAAAAAPEEDDQGECFDQDAAAEHEYGIAPDAQQAVDADGGRPVVLVAQRHGLAGREGRPLAHLPGLGIQ